MSITSIFTNNRSQGVRLPVDALLHEDVKKVLMSTHGVDRTVSPVCHAWNEFFLNGPQVSEEFIAERATQQQSEGEAL